MPLGSPVDGASPGVTGGVSRRVAGGVDGEVEADRVVLAVPASVVGRIVFEPALPAPLAEAYAAVAYGNAAKLFVPLREVPPTSAVLSVPERYWTWTATAGAGVQPVLHAFAGSAPALARSGSRTAPARGSTRSHACARTSRSTSAGAVLSTWDDDPWVGAAYSCAAPGRGLPGRPSARSTSAASTPPARSRR